MTRNEKAWFLDKRAERPHTPMKKGACIVFTTYLFIMLVCSVLLGLLLYYGLPR